MTYAVAVVSEDPTPVYMLNVQRHFHCRHSGACCTFGWHIPVEPPAYASLTEALRAGRLVVPAGESGDRDENWIDTQHPPDGAAGVLHLRPDCACVFFDAAAGRLCAIQRALGHDALPSACQQFPRISLIDDRGAHVTLSHYCPTVAGMLTADAGQAVEIVRLPAGDPTRRRAEGFDARGAVPPYLRPGVVFDSPAYGAWERGVVHALGRPDADADRSLAAISEAAEELRGWRPSRGPLADDVKRVLDAAVSRRDGVRRWPHGRAAMARLFDDVTASVPEGLPRPALPPEWEAAHITWLDPVQEALSGPVGRFLAAKAFASSAAWQGDGVRTQVMALAAARAVLRIEAARRAGVARRACDAGMLVDAARAADALLEHLSDRASLIRRWAGIESLAPDVFLSGLGLGGAA